ncbi:MAG: sigma-70 family RNA polymerase sigma factor, partial [Spirochaetaceae bacterium]|nr:sigma-70 family RNA polymerase sigma factor [Spirochaetaceae bacterium]
NVRFSTYAVWWIRQSISRAAINTGRTIRLPHRKEQLAKKIHAEKNVLSQDLKRAPTKTELSLHLGMSEKTMEELLAMTEGVSGFETSGTESSDTLNLLDRYEDYTYSPEKAFSAAMLREQTAAMLRLLSERERTVIEQRFEMNGRTRESLKKMGIEMNLSPETVRHIEKKALKTLQEEAEKGYLCMTA